MAKDDKKKKEETKKDKAPKVSPSKDKGQNDVKNKARNMLLKHPQVTQNARGLFRNENGKTIVEEIVYRGDAKVNEAVMPRNQGDLTDEDLRSLAVHASTLVDKDIAKYDTNLANEEALSMSIRSKDGGKYDGKINSCTFKLIMDNMSSMKKAAEESTEKTPLERHKELFQKEEDPKEKKEEKPSALEHHKEIVDKTKERKEEIKSEPKETPEEDTMDKEMLKKEKEALQKKLAALNELIGEKKEDTEEVVEAKEENEAPMPEEETPAEDSEACGMQKLTASLDTIAGELEGQKDPELFKLAYQLDQISEILEGKREAATFESDPDEKFMKTFFKGGLIEGEADEKSYMNEFNTDLSKEVNDVKDKKNGKEASEKLPYQKVD
jgi:hypothetical protein